MSALSKDDFPTYCDPIKTIFTIKKRFEENFQLIFKKVRRKR